MAWISKNAEQLIALCDETANAEVETVIVGSGYGAAVAALRLAENGQKVYVLERGEEYLAGDFPNDISQIGKYLRSEIASESNVTLQGYESGLFDFRVGLNAGALVGNGLGGGSLINAGVGLQPDDRVFKQPEWPAAFRNETKAELDKWFECARQMHELQTPGAPTKGSTQPIDIKRTDKYMRMQDMRSTDHLWKHRSKDDAELDISFAPVQLSIQLDSPAPQHHGLRQTCIGCGDCVTGCNHSAKLSLNTTYLAKAFKADAQMFTGVSVLHIEKDSSGNPKFPWVVHFVRTNERKQQHEIQQNSQKNQQSNRDWIYKLRAKNVVLGAGAFGSTEILLRSRSKGLKVSNTALGMGVSGNGDDITYCYDMKNAANAVGQGSEIEKSPAVGPTISSMIRFKDPNHVERGTVMQDGAIPGLLKTIAHEILTSAGTLAQMGHWQFRSHGDKDPLTLKPEALMNTLAVMGMGHDSAGGIVIYDAKADRIKWGWPKAADEMTPAIHKSRIKGCVEELGGIYLQNPAVSALPDAMGSVLSGPKLGGMVFTVHPLGGCRMGDSVITSVVNHWGAVWSTDDQLHEGLYVLDGSIIPSSLGANPMLTITALAERACSLILKSMPKKAPLLVELPDRPPATKKILVTENENNHSSTRLAEVLRGKMSVSVDHLPRNTNDFFKEKNTLDAALFLEFDIPSWSVLFADKDHKVAIIANSNAKSASYTRSRLVLSDEKTRQALELDVVSGFAYFCRLRKDAWYKSWYIKAGRYVRTGLTYLVGRWLPDRKKDGTSFTLKFLVDALKLIGHANQSREFYYEIKLADQTHQYVLTGTKRIEAAASWGALFEWLKKRLTSDDWPAPARPSVWQQLTQIQATLSYSDSSESDAKPQSLATARLVMDLPDMLRRVKPQLGLNRDNITALLGLTGYPMFLLRVILQTQLLDFRAPDYKKDLFDSDPALISKPPGFFELDHVKYPDIPARPGGVPTQAQVQPPLWVPLTWSKSQGIEPELIRIGLIRYKAAKLGHKLIDGVYRAQSIILINGFLLSTQSFVAEELNALGGNLAAQLHAAGWDVWMLEYRASPLLDVSAQDSNMDDVAAFDIPQAIDHILKTVSAELNSKFEETQIFAYSRCVGSGALAMSLLSGFLCHPGGINKLAGIQLSDFHPFLVGSVSAQLRLQVAALLSGVLKLKYVQFTAGNTKSDLLHAMMDRLFSSVDYRYEDSKSQHYLHEIKNERCPHEHDLRKHQPDSTTCKRISGLMSRSYRHAQLLPVTHEKLDFYFGRGNIGVFLQGTKCVTQERLVNADGQNAYVTDRNIQAYMNMPLLLVHGAHNALFDIESFERSKGQFQRLLPDIAGQTQNRYLRFEDFGHVDLILGKEAPKTVFPEIVKFFDAALTASLPTGPVANNRCRARMAKTGPIVGWVRTVKDADGTSVTLIRTLIEVDDAHADLPVAAMTVVEYAGQTISQVWRVQNQQFWSQGVDSQANALNPLNSIHPLSPSVCYAIADVAVPTEHINHISIQMVSIHTYAGPKVHANSKVSFGLPPSWGTPMTVDELTGSKNKTPFSGKVQSGGFNNSPLTTKLGSAFGLDPLQAPTALDNISLPQPGPAYNIACETDTRNTRLIPAYVLSPAADITSLLDPLERDLKRGNQTAYSANPQTLSRQDRTLRILSQRILQLKRPQLEDTDHRNVTFFAGGCRHPGLTGFETKRADASLSKAYEAIETRKPRFMLMLGDQIYADARAGVIDTESPIEKLLSRYHNAFGESWSFRKVAQCLPLYMVMDDHEINDNWSAEQVLQGNLNDVLAHNAYAAFTIFQYEHGPSFPADLQNPTARVEGFNYSYEHNGIPFLVLDTRTLRTRVPQRQVLHSSQWRWLEGWLLDQQKTKENCPKFIVSGSVVAPGLNEDSGYPSPRGADSWQMCPDDRKRLLSFIASNNIENVVFLSSDYHCSAAAEITFSENKTLKAWAIVAPPLHAPMRFANSEASEVLLTESIPLNAGTAQVIAKAWNGEGWLECNVQRLKPSDYIIKLTFNLRQLEEAEWPTAPITVSWPTSSMPV